MSGEDPAAGRTGALILVADDDGSIHAQRVQVVGHTSTEGADDYNLDLSRRRAQAVVEALVAHGFDMARISADGVGESQPLISPDANESARELNRRVQVTCGV